MTLKTSIFIVLLAVAFCIYEYVPWGSQNLGTAITTINGTDTLANSRTVINNNFSSLNTNKFELSDWYATTSAPQLTTLSGVTTLSNLVTVGTITSGTWNASIIGILYGGTATSTYYSGGPVFYNGTRLTQSATPANLFWDETNKRLGVGTSSPSALVSINPNGLLVPAFVIGSSTKSYFGVNQAGSISLSATQPATSTTMLLDWANTPTQVEYQIGYAATTISIVNATTSQYWGSSKRVWVCNPAGTSGVLTWTGVSWIGGTLPAQSTTPNKCDLWSFDVTRATSTSAYIVAGGMNAGL